MALQRNAPVVGTDDSTHDGQAQSAAALGSVVDGIATSLELAEDESVLIPGDSRTIVPDRELDESTGAMRFE